jgi:hypothetical protein
MASRLRRPRNTGAKMKRRSKKELESIRRKKAVKNLLATSSEGNKLSTHEIVERLAEDRKSH